MLVTLRVWFTSFQGVIDDQDTSVKRYGYFFYFISCFQLVFLSPYSLRHIIHKVILESIINIIISFCGQFCVMKVMLFCSDAVLLADKFYLRSNQQTNKYIQSLLMHFNIGECLKGLYHLKSLWNMGTFLFIPPPLDYRQSALFTKQGKPLRTIHTAYQLKKETML